MKRRRSRLAILSNHRYERSRRAYVKFLSRILKRPNHERPFLLIPVGYPAEDCLVPDITKKPLSEIMVLNEGNGPSVHPRTSDGSR